MTKQVISLISFRKTREKLDTSGAMAISRPKPNKNLMDNGEENRSNQAGLNGTNDTRVQRTSF